MTEVFERLGRMGRRLRRGQRPRSRRPFSPRPDVRAVPYGVALAGATLLTVLNATWPDFFRSSAPFLLYLPVVLASSWLGETAAGLAATLLCAAALAYLDLPPYGSFAVRRGADRFDLALFAGLGMIASWVNRKSAQSPPVEGAPERGLLPLLRGLADCAVFTLNADGLFVDSGPGAEKMLGCAKEQIIGTDLAAFHRPEDAPLGRPAALLDKAAASGFYAEKAWRRRNDGSQFRANVLIAARYDESGRQTGFFMIMQDMTLSREQDERFRVALEAAPAGMILVDKTGRIVLANEQARRLFGYERAELLGRPVEMLVPEKLRERHRALRQGYDQVSRRMNGRELEAQRKDGTKVPVAIGLTPIGADGDMGVIAGITDLTRFKPIERELRRANERLARRLAELEEFSFTVSHDLRAPLRHIEGFVHLLEQQLQGTLEPRTAQTLSRIAAAASKMDLLTQDVLIYSRIARGEPQLGPVDLEKFVPELIARYPDFAAAGIKLSLSRSRVTGNESLLTQALSNLIGNALKFMPPDRAPIVEVEAERRGTRVRLWIKDNGIGIAPHFLDRLFKPFERLPEAERYPGTGIGLAIVKRAAERMGGRAGVESQLGVGSRFWIELDEG